MRLPHNSVRLLLLLALALFGLECHASAAPAVSSSPPAKSVAAITPMTTPDYGGRESIVNTAVDTSGAQTMNPLGQAGRAFEALVIVLALVVGGLYLLKRSGLIKSNGTGPEAPPWTRRQSHARQKSSGPPEVSTNLISVLGSQTLPNGSGAGLHLISVGGKTLLLGETAQAVTLLTEIEAVQSMPLSSETETSQERAAFAEYLVQAGISPKAPSSLGAVGVSLSSTADRLQSLLSRSREETMHP